MDIISFKGKKRLVVTLHATWLVMLILILQYIPFTRTDEIGFLKWAAIFKHNILGKDQKPLKDSVVFIDVSHDLELIPDQNIKYDSSNLFKGPQQVITDRRKLGYLLSIINQHPTDYKYILCDILFADSSADDSIFKHEIESTKRIISTGYLTNGTEQLVKPVFQIPFGIVNYNALNQSLFYKMPIMYTDTLKSLPVGLFEEVSGKKFHNYFGFTEIDGSLTFNYVLPEFYYRPNDLVYSSDNDSLKTNAYYLGELLLMGKDCFELLKGKYIVIANFSDDNHSTYLGEMPGALILWDNFLTLLNSSIKVSITWIVILYIICWGLSYKIFVYRGQLFSEFEERVRKLKWKFLQKFILKYVSFLGICLIVDLISLFFFRTFISIFYLATYLTACDLFVERKNELLARFKLLFSKKIWHRATVQFFIIFILTSHLANKSAAQYATVTHIQGKIYKNGTLLKISDKVTASDTLKTDDSNSQLGLLDIKQGRIFIKFLNGKPLKTKSEDKHSELFALTVGEYIQKYTTVKILTHKGSFDLIDFFSDTTGNQVPIRIMLIEDQKLPLVSSKVSFTSSDKLFMCGVQNSDTICKVLPLTKDSIWIYGGIFKKGSWTEQTTLLKVGYFIENQYMERYFPYQLKISVVKKAVLIEIIQAFKRNFMSFYQGDESSLRKDIYAEISYWYGRFYEPDVDKLIDETPN